MLLAQTQSTSNNVQPANRFRSALLRQPALSINAAPKVGAGVSLGCFAGVGYGLAIGIGSVAATTTRNNTALVVPSIKTQPFAHDGAMVGAFCGVVIGGGFATGIGTHLGYRWSTFMDGWFQILGSKFIVSFKNLLNR